MPITTTQVVRMSYYQRLFAATISTVTTRSPMGSLSSPILVSRLRVGLSMFIDVKGGFIDDESGLIDVYR